VPGIDSNSGSLCGSQEVIHCAGKVECGDFVAVAGKDAIDGQAPDAERENRIGLQVVPRRPAEGLGISPACRRKPKRQVQMAGVLGGGEPPSGVASGLGQIS
jgi:hypothetical protein